MKHSDTTMKNNFDESDAIKRPLGKTEAVFQMMDDVQPNNFAVIVRIKKEINASQVKIALRKEIERNPILGSKIITREGRYYFQKEPINCSVNLQKINMPEDELHETIAGHLCLPFPRGIAPLYRFLFIETPENNYLVGIYCHSIGDGRSASSSMKRVLLTALDVNKKQEKCANNLNALSLSLADAATQLPWPVTKFMAFGVSNIKRLLRNAMFGEPEHIPQFKLPENTYKNELNILAEEIQGDAFHNMLTICKLKRITVNTLMVTLLFKSLNRQWYSPKDRNMGMTITVDLCKRLGIDRLSKDFGLYMGSMSFISKISRKASIWKTADVVAKDIDFAMRCNEQLFFELLPKKIMKEKTEMAKTMAPPTKGPILSNVGKVYTDKDEKKLSMVAQDIYFTFNPRRQMTFGLTISTYNNRLKLILAHNPSLISPSVCRDILMDFKCILKDVTKGES